MVSEIRHIMFRPSEVVEAFREFSRRSGTPLPLGHIVRCGPETDGAGTSVRFRIVIAPEAVGGKGAPGAAEPVEQDITINSPVLAAALILYCRDRRVPLPAAADKSLQMFGDQVCLIAALNPKQDKMTASVRLGPVAG